MKTNVLIFAVAAASVALAGCATTMQAAFNLPSDISETDARAIVDQVMGGDGKVRLDERTLAAFGGMPPGESVAALAKLKLGGRLIEKTRRTSACQQIDGAAEKARNDLLPALSAARQTLFDGTANALIERGAGVVGDYGCEKQIRKYSWLAGVNRDPSRADGNNLRGYNGDSARYFAKVMMGYEMYREFALAENQRVAELAAASSPADVGAAWRKLDHADTCKLLQMSVYSQRAGLLLKSAEIRNTVWSVPHYQMFCELSGINDVFRAGGVKLP